MYNKTTTFKMSKQRITNLKRIQMDFKNSLIELLKIEEIK